MPTPTTPTDANQQVEPHVPAAGADALGELGRTTSSRGWLVLVALLLVIVAFVGYGLFGSIPVQSTVQANVTNGSYPVQITAGVTGTIASIVDQRTESEIEAAGTTIMTVQLSTGGKPVPIKTPLAMSYTLDVVLGSPVSPQTVVAHGFPTSGAGGNNGKAQVYAFLSLAAVETLKSAESMTVTPTAPSLADTTAPIKVAFIGSVPVSQEQISLITGNTIYAQQSYTEAAGAPYLVLFTYLNAADADAVTTSAAAEITVTESTPHPLQLLFG